MKFRIRMKGLAKETMKCRIRMKGLAKETMRCRNEKVRKMQNVG